MSTGSGEMGPSVQLTIFAGLCNHDPSHCQLHSFSRLLKTKCAGFTYIVITEKFVMPQNLKTERLFPLQECSFIIAIKHFITVHTSFFPPKKQCLLSSSLGAHQKLTERTCSGGAVMDSALYYLLGSSFNTGLLWFQLWSSN